MALLDFMFQDFWHFAGTIYLASIAATQYSEYRALKAAHKPG